MRVDRGRDIGRLAVHCSVCGSVRIQFARTWRCMNWTLLQQMSEKTVYVLIPNLTENPIIESEKYKFPGMRASHPRRKKAGLTSKKRSVWRAEGKIEDIQMAGRCFTDTFIVRFPARHFSDDKCVGRSFEKAFPLNKMEIKVVAQKQMLGDNKILVCTFANISKLISIHTFVMFHCC